MAPGSPSQQQHEEASRRFAEGREIHCAVLTISDTRTIESDASGDCICAVLKEHGFTPAARMLVKDEPEEVGRAIDAWVADPDIDVILSTGGTGIAQRDTTVEVVRRRIAIEIEGFGELFRMISFADIGPAAMLSRAVAGVIMPGGDTPQRRGVIVFAMPGSRNAVETAMRRLIVPQLPHLVWERAK